MQLRTTSHWSEEQQCYVVTVRNNERISVYHYSPREYRDAFRSTRSLIEAHAQGRFRREINMEETQDAPYMQDDVTEERVEPLDLLRNVPNAYRGEPMNAQHFQEALQGRITRATGATVRAAIGEPTQWTTPGEPIRYTPHEDPATKVLKAMVTLMYKKLILTSEQYKAIMDTLKPGNTIDELLFVMESINKGDF